MIACSLPLDAAMCSADEEGGTSLVEWTEGGMYEYCDEQRGTRLERERRVIASLPHQLVASAAAAIN